MIHKSANGRVLLTSNKDSFKLSLGQWTPHVVILTAWNIAQSSVLFWQPLIYYLLDRGLTYISCVGDYSEKLHDEIDNLIYHYESDQNNNFLNIITTYHSNDTIEEAVDYCFYGTELKEKDHQCILAILDDESVEDKKLRERLLKV